jgi:hypothetical protein
MRTRTTKALFGALALALTLAGQASAQGREEIAVTGAREWLALVDAGQFPQSWEQAGEIIRNSVTSERWAASLTGLRQPLGTLTTRNLKTVVVAENLPNAPQGKYVVTTFSTSFANGQTPFVEVVTSYLESASNQWKVVGYSLKPPEGQNGQTGGAQQGGAQQQPPAQQPPAQQAPAEQAPPPPPPPAH